MNDFYKNYISNQTVFEVLVKNSNDIIAVINAEGTILYESPAFEKILGYKVNEVIGLNAFSFVHPDDINKAKQKVIDLIQKK